jgi:hypoxanthine phosphoribosyltransferase
VKRLIDEPDIRAQVTALGRQIAADYEGKPLTVLGVLTGSVVLLADLIRCVNLPLRVGLIQASSYRGAATDPGELTINSGLVPDIKGRDVLLIDDIFDTGRTLTALTEAIAKREPNSLRSAVLLVKEGRRVVGREPDYFCFRIPDVFVVGYGLDYNDEHRYLPYIAALDDADL